jgi:hypothetical protein
MAKLEQPLRADFPISTRTRTIQSDPLGAQLIHPKQSLIQGPFKLFPPFILTQQSQHIAQPVITEIKLSNLLPKASTQGRQALACPALHMVKSMVGLGKNMGQPHHGYLPKAQSLPVAMGWNVLVQQGLDPHSFQCRQQHGNIINAFIFYNHWFAHTENLTYFLILFQF